MVWLSLGPASKRVAAEVAEPASTPPSTAAGIGSGGSSGRGGAGTTISLGEGMGAEVGATTVVAVDGLSSPVASGSQPHAAAAATSPISTRTEHPPRRTMGACYRGSGAPGAGQCHEFHGASGCDEKNPSASQTNASLSSAP